MKIGSTNVSSFRLGDTTPSKVYVGDTETWTSGPPATAPAAIGSVTADTSITSQSAIDVSWPTPDDGGSAITGYNVYLSTDGGASYSLHTNVASSPYEYIEPYRGGQSRVFDIRAVNAVGEAATASMYGTANLSDSPPSAPTNLTIVNAPGYDLLVEWDAPTHSGGQSQTDYEVGYQAPASSESTALTSNMESYTLDLLSIDMGYTYSIRVRAINPLGNGEWSAAITSPAIADVPDVSSSTSASTSSSNQGAVTLNILVPNANGSGITSYDVEIDYDGTFTAPVSLTNYTDQPLGGGYFNKEITGLAGGVTYYFRIRFVNSVGNGAWTTSGLFASASNTPPAQVTDFTVTPDYSGAGTSTYEWDFAWTEPSSGGSSITGYEIEEAATDNFSGATTVYPSPGSTYTTTANDRDQNRYFRIRAVNSVGNGAWSAVQTAYYDTPTVPGAPTVTSATVDGGTNWTNVSFNSPADDGNSAVTSYSFYFDSVLVAPDSTGANTATFYSDYSGQDLTMTATNSVGEGAASDPYPVT